MDEVKIMQYRVMECVTAKHKRRGAVPESASVCVVEVLCHSMLCSIIHQNKDFVKPSLYFLLR